jgi:hypothetical protein
MFINFLRVVTKILDVSRHPALNGCLILCATDNVKHVIHDYERINSSEIFKVKLITFVRLIYTM